jgi:hypothetical protein
MRRSFRWISVILLAAAAASPVLPGEKPSLPADSTSVNSLVPGAWGLMFQIDNGFYINSYLGSILSAKKQLTGASSIRFGLHLTGAVQTKRNESTGESDDDVLRETQEDRLRSYDIGLSAQFVRNYNTHRTLSPFWAVGPYVGARLVREDTERSTNWGDSEKRFYRRRDNSLVLGVNANVGIEWFVSKEISFLAEYGLVMTYQKTDTRNESPSVTNDGHAKQLNMQQQSKRIGLCLYF